MSQSYSNVSSSYQRYFGGGPKMSYSHRAFSGARPSMAGSRVFVSKNRMLGGSSSYHLGGGGGGGSSYHLGGGGGGGGMAGGSYSYQRVSGLGSGAGAGTELDFSLNDAVNTNFMETRKTEKAEMQDLNDRFASYIDKVRFLESQNKMLTAELDRLRGQGPSRLNEIVEAELRELRIKVETFGGDKTRLEIERDNLAEDNERLRQRLDEETQRRIDAEKSLTAFRKDVDDATLARVDLERRIEALHEEIAFLKKLHEDELGEMRSLTHEPMLALEAQPEAAGADLAAALREVRTQFEGLATRNMHEAEEWYKMKFTDLSEAATKHSDALKQSRQEVMELRHQIQTSGLDAESLRGANEGLQKQLRNQEERHNAELTERDDMVAHLQAELSRIKDEMSRQLRHYQELLNVKLALDVEIATYRKLLEGEETRIVVPMQHYSGLHYHDASLDDHETEVHAKKTVVIKTIETKDGEVVSEKTQHHEETL
uniref:desmin-like n=1 Tax=Myxine glutinosa TaxID=7769 RepID=UPI00358FCDAD